MKEQVEPGSSAVFLFSALVRDEVRAYEAVVLAAKWACAELARGGPLGGRRGRRGASVPWVEPTAPGTGNEEAQQWFDEVGDEAEHGDSAVDVAFRSDRRTE